MDAWAIWGERTETTVTENEERCCSSYVSSAEISHPVLGHELWRPLMSEIWTFSASIGAMWVFTLIDRSLLTRVANSGGQFFTMFLFTLSGFLALISGACALTRLYAIATRNGIGTRYHTYIDESGDQHYHQHSKQYGLYGMRGDDTLSAAASPILDLRSGGIFRKNRILNADGSAYNGPWRIADVHDWYHGWCGYSVILENQRRRLFQPENLQQTLEILRDFSTIISSNFVADRFDYLDRVGTALVETIRFGSDQKLVGPSPKAKMIREFAEGKLRDFPEELTNHWNALADKREHMAEQTEEITTPVDLA